MGSEQDAYAVLQVVRTADDDVIRAAYRALARRYHPDGLCPDPARMAAINGAYERLRDPGARRRYDATAAGVAVGPGPAEDPYDAWLARHPDVRAGSPASVVDFGRYQGWKIVDLAHHDPDYLRWLSRHSMGIRFHDAIVQALPGDPQVGRRGAAS